MVGDVEARAQGSKELHVYQGERGQGDVGVDVNTFCAIRTGTDHISRTAPKSCVQQSSDKYRTSTTDIVPLPHLDCRDDNVVKARYSLSVLRFVFYWFTFMPLARGTAGVGFATLVGLLYGGRMPPMRGVPRGK